MPGQMIGSHFHLHSSGRLKPKRIIFKNAGSTPIVANSYGSGTATVIGNTGTFQGSSTTYYSGGTPIILNRHNQALQVRMFKADDPQAVNALDARRALGHDWPKLVAKGTVATCAE